MTIHNSKADAAVSKAPGRSKNPSNHPTDSVNPRNGITGGEYSPVKAEVPSSPTDVTSRDDWNEGKA